MTWNSVYAQRMGIKQQKEQMVKRPYVTTMAFFTILRMLLGIYLPNMMSYRYVSMFSNFCLSDSIHSITTRPRHTNVLLPYDRIEICLSYTTHYTARMILNKYIRQCTIRNINNNNNNNIEA